MHTKIHTQKAHIKNMIREVLSVQITSIHLIYNNTLLNIYHCYDNHDRHYAVKILLSNTSTSSLAPCPLTTEATMLTELRDYHIPYIPRVFYQDNTMLIMQWIEQIKVPFSYLHYEQLAIFLSTLHSITTDYYGYPYDNYIGVLKQTNTQHNKWSHFFKEYRLVAPAKQALHMNKISTDFYERLISFANNKVEELIVNPVQPSLIHGDIWHENILYNSHKITAIIDPSLYFAHYEMEIAYLDMFHLTSTQFYSCYTQQYPLDTEFFHSRCAIYQIYPHLIHVMMWSPTYLTHIDTTLRYYGY